MTYLFLLMGILDYVRGRVLTRIGARFQARLDAKHVDDGAAEQVERARDDLARARSGHGEVR